MTDNASASETGFASSLTCLLFRVAGERYALPLLLVASVHPVMSITRVPGTSSLIRGIIDLRGTLLPVIDLARVLGLAEARRQSSHVIVVRGSQQDVALLVDEAQDILQIDPAAVEPRLGTLSVDRAELLEGQVQTRFGLVGLLRLSRVFEAVQHG